MSHMMFTRTRHRTRLLADQTMATLGDLQVAADRVGLLAVNAPDHYMDALRHIENAADAHRYAMNRVGGAADDMALTVACVGLAVICAAAIAVWRSR